MKIETSHVNREPNLPHAEAQSLNVLSDHGIEHPKFNIDALARAMGLDVKYGGLDEADAWLFRKNKGKSIIRISDRIHTESRQRFSLAHELGHWVMHPHLKQLTACTAENLADYTKSTEEVEANWFAATLLMPHFMVRGLIASKDPSFSIIETIAEDFGTSRIAASRRFVELTKERVILVYSQNGKVIWKTKSKSARYHALISDIIPENSWTHKANQEKVNPHEHQLSPQETWLKGNPYSVASELFEDVRIISSLNAAMTLLWFPSQET